MRYLLLLILLTPFVTFGALEPQKSSGGTTFADFVDKVLEFNQQLLLIIFGLTFIVLIWGIAKTWIMNGGDEKEIENGKQIVLAGIIALVIMVGIWGILAILQSSLFDI